MRNRAKIDYIKWNKINRCYKPPGGSFYQFFQRSILNRVLEDWEIERPNFGLKWDNIRGEYRPK